MLELVLSGSGLVGLVLMIFLVLELSFPARTYDGATIKNTYLTNALIFATNTLATYTLSVATVWVFVEQVSLWSSSLWSYNAVLTFIFSFLILEIAIWFWHKINHEVPFLWRFHQAHHSELYLNSTSALRFHIGELLLSILFKSILLVVTGIPLWVFFIHETAITIFAIFHHANIQFPKRVSRIISFVFITPRMHYAHHSTIRSEHNSNYGVIFSWWDHIFKTVNRKEPEKIGLLYTKEHQYLDFLKMPLKSFGTKDSTHPSQTT